VFHCERQSNRLFSIKNRPGLFHAIELLNTINDTEVIFIGGNNDEPTITAIALSAQQSNVKVASATSL
jgi:dTDP-glucose pyrophosphorylase